MNARRLILLGPVILGPFILCSCATVQLEEAKYEVIEKEGDFEIRQYEPQIVAETIVDADFDDAGNIAFRRLFNYISGANRTGESISMTAPVNMQKTDGEYSVTFLMPSKYTIQTLPDPSDDNVKLRQIGARKTAAIRYSGTWSRKRYEARRTLLEDWVRKKGLTIAGEDIFARYDPPFQLWFLRRNEVLYPVE